MFILTSLLMAVIALVIYLCKGAGQTIDDFVQDCFDENAMKDAKDNEDAWLAQTDLVVRENGELMFYPKVNTSRYKAGNGYNAYYYQDALRAVGERVFSTEDLYEMIHCNSNTHRMLYIDNERVIPVGKFPIGKVYKKVGKEEYYIDLDNPKQVYKGHSGFSKSKEWAEKSIKHWR